MRAWDWYIARRKRKADERRLEERRRDEAMGNDPGKAMNASAQRIKELNRPQGQQWPPH
jgi:hypothetical protein